MSIWPFRRKSKRKNAGAVVGAKRAVTEPITAMQRSWPRRSIGSARRNGSQTELSGLARKRTGRLKNKKQSADGGNKLVRDPERRTYSFSPGRKESLAIPKDIHRQYPVPPIPADATNMPGKSGTINPRTGARIYPTTTDDSIDRAPTLHKRIAVDLNHRRSSKKRKEDSERLSELKAMTMSMPPPSSRPATTPDPFRADTVKSRGVKRIFTNHTLNMSLPHHESMHSSNSSDVEGHTSYILKGIDLFSPRPTIRYAEHPRHKYKSTPNVERAPIMSSRADEFDKEKSRKRIEELADELNAHDLHELMDRDRRRRERKKQHDLEKAERRLARRAAKQAGTDKEAEALVGQPVDDQERRALARESGALGIHTPIEDRPPLVPRRSSRRNSRRNSRRGSALSSTYSQELTEKLQDLQDDQRASAQSPIDGFIRSESLPGTEPTSPYDERDEVIIQTAQIARLSRANMSPPASPARHFHDHRREQSNVSQMKDLPPAPILSGPTPLPTSPPSMLPKKEDTPPSEERKAESAYRRSSETGSSFQHSSWKSWFKRTSKDRRSSTQSSFSNTTRESIIASQQSNPQATAPPPVAYSTPVGQNSGIPKRTMSRFREDLPELPISPPASRVQSPEVMPIPVARNLDPHRAHIGRELSDTPSGLRRYDSPNSFNRPTEQGSLLRYETPNTERMRDAPSPEPVNLMSQSLASIDSEGSWLSGRPRADSKRSSAQRSSARSSRQQGDYSQIPSRHSHGSLQARRYKDFSDQLDGGEDIAEDEYYSRLTPDMYNRTANMEPSRISGNPMPSSDESDNERMRTPISAGAAGKEGKWGDVSRKPTIIRHVQRTHSAQGVLNNCDDASSDEDEHILTQEKLDERWKEQGPDYRPRTPESPTKEDEDSQLDQASPEILERATSIDYRKNHIRHISAGSARLLDLKPRMSGEHASKRKSVGF